MFVRRDRKPVTRWVGLRVGMFFLAAGMWLAGVRTGNNLITGIAIAVAVLAMLLSLYLRRVAARHREQLLDAEDP